MELDSRKKNRRDRMMGSKSFETQEVRKIGRKKQVSREAFPSDSSFYSYLSSSYSFLSYSHLFLPIFPSGPVAVDEERLEAAA